MYKNLHPIEAVYKIKKQDIRLAICKFTGKECRMNNIISDSCRNAPAPIQKTYKVGDVARILGIGRSSAYNLVKEGHFKVVRIGTSIRVSRKSFDEWLNNQA